MNSYDAFEAFQQNINEKITVDPVENFTDSDDERKNAPNFHGN